jgi:putative endonuclease
MKAWTVYIVRCSDKSLYTGITNDLNKRISKHNSGKGAKYTRNHRPVILVYEEQVTTKSKALKREAQIKKLRKYEKEKLVANHIPNDVIQAHIKYGLKQTVNGWITNQDLIGRLDFQRNYSWAIPNEEALRTICEFSPIIEMGAGTGYWAKLLQNRGCNILAFDICPPGSSWFGRNTPIVNVWHPGSTRFTNVVNGNPRVLDLYTSKSLFLCWPPKINKMAEDCLKYWKGEFLIYIGNLNLTANSKFFNKLEREFTLAHKVEIPNWIGIIDQMYVWRRK